jgi:valyl-tRNA synthetase
VPDILAYLFLLQSKNIKGRKPYVIPMPPPNVTGYLHMGHAMFVALQVS